MTLNVIDISKVNYKTYILRETGELLNVTGITMGGPNWEENDGELAMRLSVELANVIYGGERISSIAKPNCYIIVLIEVEGDSEEVARAKITEWKPTRSGSEDKISLSGYDELFDLQASQDNRYISDGVSTKTALMAIFDDWGIPVETYEGPDVAHAKTLFKNDYLSDIILELLDTAHKHGGEKCIVRASKGQVSVIPRASNDTVFCFEEGQNLIQTSYKIDASDVITVVKVVATEDEDERQAVEALIEGKTEYGKRQRIYVRDDDDSLADATAAANEILAEEGEPTHTISVKAPDVPMLRKGDKIKITTRIYTGYAVVLSVSHDAENKTMTLDLEKYEAAEAEADTDGSGDYAVGDIVDFKGGYHYYTSTDSSPRGGLRTAGKAQITAAAPGAAHPWHLIGGAYSSIGGNSNVYGWVDEGTFS